MVKKSSSELYYSTEKEAGRGNKVKFKIYDRDTDSYHDIIVIIEDYEIDKLWGKITPIVDIESTEVEIKPYWDIKQQVVAELRKNKVKIFGGVFYTKYQKYSLLIDYRYGQTYHFNNHMYKHEINEQDGQEIFLQKYDSLERMCVYRNGVFYSEKNNWLMKSSQAFSKGECSGIKIHSDFYGEIKIKDHQIIAAMFIGQEAIELTMGENAKFEINHRNLNNSDNSFMNLEVITGDQNKKHSRIFNKLLESKLVKKLKEIGVTNYEIKGKTNL
ncbi:hypothetical protein [Lysinibacillus fusiformis]|uniref:hypothetical protein n=1 Tax=Lysinibacillus fusiformis TaxID=28031 RepID=UPI003CE6DD29